MYILWFFFSSRRRHTKSKRDLSSDVCSSDLSCSFGGRSCCGKFIARAAQQTASQLSNNIFLCRPGSSVGKRKRPSKAKAVNHEMLSQTNAEKLLASSNGYCQ